jgi:hypothetical protein
MNYDNLASSLINLLDKLGGCLGVPAAAT